MTTTFSREPVFWMYLLQTVLSVAVAFGLHVNTSQIAAPNAAIAAVLSFIARSLVHAGREPHDRPGGNRDARSCAAARCHEAKAFLAAGRSTGHRPSLVSRGVVSSGARSGGGVPADEVEQAGTCRLA
jgi:hypothetical protein